MLSRVYSFKFIIGFALLWLGALAYGLAIYSTQVYREHAIPAQIDSLQSMLEHESREAIEQLSASFMDSRMFLRTALTLITGFCQALSIDRT